MDRKRKANLQKAARKRLASTSRERKEQQRQEDRTRELVEKHRPQGGAGAEMNQLRDWIDEQLKLEIKMDQPTSDAEDNEATEVTVNKTGKSL